jgi:hypothetical protein
MKMSTYDIKKYPKLAYYVRVNIPEVLKVPVIVNAFNKIGGINRPTLRGALKWGAGPTIKITIPSGAFGEFTPDCHSMEIRIERKIVEDFEAGKGKRVARAGSVYLVGVTLLHELIHWADDQDGIDRPGEEGGEFERAMYGKVIY